MPCQPGSVPGNANLFRGTAVSLTDIAARSKEDCIRLPGGSWVDGWIDSFDAAPEMLAFQFATVGVNFVQQVIPAIASGGASIPLQGALALSNLTDPNQETRLALRSASTLAGSLNWEAANMGLDLGFDDFDFGGLFEDFSFSDALKIGAPVVQSLITPNQGLPVYQTLQQTPQYQTMATNTNLPATIPQGGAIANTVSRGFFNKYPGIATVLAGLRSAGQAVTANSLYGKLLAFGAPALMGFLANYVGQPTAQLAVTELAIRGRKHRRMNPCNAKALTRAARRIKSFHNKCKTIDLLKKSKRRC